MLIGCNTIGHLAAGLFEIQRTGDDTSGKEWERTRRMGVNTLAYRLPQHGAFFVMDGDCVPITTATPWEKNKQWLDLIARSGTALFVSPEPRAIGPEQRQALKEAFEVAASKPTGLGHATGNCPPRPLIGNSKRNTAAANGSNTTGIHRRARGRTRCNLPPDAQ